MKAGLGFLSLVASLGCASTATQKSTGTNWIACESDADCEAFPGARCGDAKVCVDRTGARIPRSALTGEDGGPGAGGAGSGGTSQAGADSGTSPGGGGTGGGAGGSPPGSGGATDGGPAVAIVDCYSPGQNIDHAYEPGAVGCACPGWAPGLCIGGVALICQDGRWQAVEDGPCWECWTPDKPDLAGGYPANGCDCTTENETACMFTNSVGYMTATCTGGKWTRTVRSTSCDCTADVRCGFGSRCESGTCLPGTCEVDGVRYAVGVAGIPDSWNCNSCECQAGGFLACTERACPSACPPDTTLAHVCIACGTAGGCSISRTGCLPRCETSDDCAATYTPVCDAISHACSSGPCL